MPGELTFSTGTLCAFLMVLSRISGVLVFVPIPGVRNAAEPARVMLILGITMALFPLWPSVPEMPGMGKLALWMMSEAALGLTAGLAVTFVTEAFLVAAQVLGLQAGFSYASTIDPTTQADANMLTVLAQLIGGMLFFAVGLHREVFRLLARSLEVYPPGEFVLGPGAADRIVHLGSGMFSLGLRLALPVAALLVLIDLALALIGKLNPHLQLLTLAFPLKICASLFVLATVASLFPGVFRRYAGEAVSTLWVLIGR